MILTSFRYNSAITGATLRGRALMSAVYKKKTAFPLVWGKLLVPYGRFRASQLARPRVWLLLCLALNCAIGDIACHRKPNRPATDWCESSTIGALCQNSCTDPSGRFGASLVVAPYICPLL
jgi:hypothetical protein